MSTSAFQPRRLLTMFGADTRNVSRDPTLAFAILLSAVPALLIYFWRDAIDAAALSAFGVEEIIAFAMPVALCLPAFLIGWVSGFLFLEDRDDGPLLAVEVTPVGKQGFIAYRASVTMALTFVLTWLATQFILPEQPVVMRLFLSVLVAIESLATAFILPAIARNKVEGLALTKLTNIAAIVPLLAIVPSPWRYVAAVVPTYWIGELLGISGQSYLSMPVMVGLATATHIIAAWLLFKMISRRVG